MSHDDIAAASGLNRATVRELSFRRSWIGYSVETASAFSAACGVNLIHPRPQVRFLKHCKHTHVSSAVGSQREMYAKLSAIILEEAQKRRSALR